MFNFNFEKMYKSIYQIEQELIQRINFDQQRSKEDDLGELSKIIAKYNQEERLSQEEFIIINERLFQDIIAKHKRGQPLSVEEMIILTRRVFPLLERSEITTVSMKFLNACRDLLFASNEEYHEKLTAFIKLIREEIEHIPFHPNNPKEIVEQILKYFFEIGEIKDETEYINYRSAIILLVKFYNRHHEKKIDLGRFAYTRNFVQILFPCIDSNIMIRFSLFKNIDRNHYHMMMSVRKLGTSPKCTICREDRGGGNNFLASFERFIKLFINNEMHCRCWEMFAIDNLYRSIPCSVGGFNGPHCSFCNNYKKMHLIELIGVLNDSFKHCLMRNDVYDDLFDTLYRIIAGGSLIQITQLMEKLLSYQSQQLINVELYQKLFRLITKFEEFFQRMQCIPMPNFLFTPYLRNFTEADYTNYMDRLKFEQDNFQTMIPTLGFCNCREIAISQTKSEIKS